jgi:hypothetical protein
MKWRRGFDLGAAVVLLAPAVFAAPPPSLRMVGEETACPTPAQVVAVLRRLLPRTKVIAETGSAAPADAAITDEGTQYRVTIAGQERFFVDGARQCAERARHAAVFVALVLDPPLVPGPAEPTPAAPPTPPPSPPPSERPAAVSPPPTLGALDFTLGTVLQVAPAAGDRRTTVAAGVMAWARAKRGFHLALGTGVLRGAFQFDDIAADAWWVPIHLAAGITYETEPWEVGAEVGPSATILSVRGRELEQAESQVRVEWGGRASAFSRFWFSKNFALYLAGEALVRPSTYALLIQPQGPIGFTPGLWLGGSAGLSCRLE